MEDEQDKEKAEIIDYKLGEKRKIRSNSSDIALL
jgi:hypothetical protein